MSQVLEGIQGLALTNSPTEMVIDESRLCTQEPGRCSSVGKGLTFAARLPQRESTQSAEDKKQSFQS